MRTGSVSDEPIKVGSNVIKHFTKYLDNLITNLLNINLDLMINLTNLNLLDNVTSSSAIPSYKGERLYRSVNLWRNIVVFSHNLQLKVVFAWRLFMCASKLNFLVKVFSQSVQKIVF